jgi:hypothetical protein
VAVCTGYLTGWLTDLHGFRRRSLVERIFWSVPLSFSVATIGSVLVGKFVSLGAVVLLYVLSAAACVFLLLREHIHRRRAGMCWLLGVWPLGGVALLVAAVWVAVVLLSLVDLQSGQKLYMNMAILDQSYRVAWMDAVLRTGVPPHNPQFWFHQPAAMHNYYFWYVICAGVARMTHLPMRAVMTAGCVWSGVLLAAVTGLYLKHFLCAGERLRRQFLQALGLCFVTGLDLLVVIWGVIYAQQAPAPDFEAWSKDGVISWLHTLLWAPHHLAGMLCCMFAFLLAWLSAEEKGRRLAVSGGLIAAAVASAFGMSIYSTFAFFVLMVLWAVWRVAVERKPRTAVVLASGGAGAVVLIMPYLLELTHTASGMHGAGASVSGGLPFAFTVREMIPPDGLLTMPLMQRLAAVHPIAALNTAKLTLLAPGYALEFGFYLAVLLIYMAPAWRGRVRLTEAQRTLVFLALAALPAMTFLRSSVLEVNDFGWRAALLMQFPLLLLGSEVLAGWRLADRKQDAELAASALPRSAPNWLRAVAALALVVGFFGTICQALSLRLAVPAAVAVTNTPQGWAVHEIPHNTYLSAVGYAHMDATIPRDAIVQYNPYHPSSYWMAADMLGANRQAAIANDQPWCGSELGGDPSGCVPMAAAMDAVFKGSDAAQARATCHQFGVQYLVATVYDPAWKRGDGWVWTLPAVVADPEFRALDCR